MTIREMEEKAGMTRANIRYYEREGLIPPLRGANNYRDYSMDDLAALQKIRLLRQLHIPVAEIARLERGELSLDTVLAAQGAALEQESHEMARAAQLCREMWKEHISYDGLNAEEWLNRSPVPESAQVWKRDDVLFTAPHPWRRLLAQNIDYAITGTLLWMAGILVLRFPVGAETGAAECWLFQAVATFFEGILEALLLCTIGTTPGKWIFGLQVRGRDGGKLSFPRAAFRALQRFIFGEACGIPLLNLWRYWVSCKACANDQVLPWDEDVAYQCTPHRWRHLLCIPVWPLCLAAMMAAMVQSLLPAHQGPLTKAEFIENCEIYARQHLGFGYLDDDLRWKQPGNPETVVTSLPPETDFRDTPYELTTDSEGHITAVHIGYESHRDEGWIPHFDGTVSILRTNYALASNHTGLLSFFQESRLWEGRDWMEDFTFTDGCIKVTHEIEYRGYEAVQGILFRDPDKAYHEEPYFRWSLTLERLG